MIRPGNNPKQQNGIPLDLKTIEEMLPHRGVALRVDLAIYYPPKTEDENPKLSSIRVIRSNDPDLEGHFGLYPGHCQLECACIAAGLLAGMIIDTSKMEKVFFMGTDKVRYRKMVVPGDILEIEVELVKNRKGKIFSFDVKIFNFLSSELVAEFNGLSGMAVEKSEEKKEL